MGKKYRIAILAFMLIFTLAACKGKESSKQEESETTSKDVVSEETSPKETDAEETDFKEDLKENVSRVEENSIPDTWDESSKESTTPSNDLVEETETPESPNNPKTPNTDSSTDDSDKEYQYEDDKGWLPWV